MLIQSDEHVGTQALVRNTRQTDRQTDRQTNKQTDRDRQRQRTDRQKDTGDKMQSDNGTRIPCGITLMRKLCALWNVLSAKKRMSTANVQTYKHSNIALFRVKLNLTG